MSMNFRELVHPGTNYEFMGRGKLLFAVSMLLCLLSIALLPLNQMWRGTPLNFSIDFKGGTEIVATFAKPVDAGAVRKAMTDAGHHAVEVSSFRFKDAKQQERDAYLVRVGEFTALAAEKAQAVSNEFASAVGADVVKKARWSGDAFHIRTTKPVAEEELSAFLAKQGLEMKPWTAEQKAEFRTVRPGTNEYEAVGEVHGLVRNIQQQLAKALDTQVTIEDSEGVGAKAGEELRNDGIRSTLYAIALIVLYIALRFDLRYGPASVAALLVNTIITVGAFAITWQEFSLTTVAAVLTVIGYGINDTVVVFDRIRENEGKLKDKKFDRVINISINETLSRTLLVSFATFTVTLAMNLLGTGLVSNFAFAMNVGIVVSTLSTIFVACPVLLMIHEHYYAGKPATKRGKSSVAATKSPA
jgi:preprotein translocase subunit SecF